jgi:predicted glutamine amidotransferase
MCVILHKTAPVKEQDIIDAYNYNPDGFGVMYQENGKVVTDKGMYDLDTILAKLWYLQDIEYVAHFRITTRGKTNDDNCHPFRVSDKIWMMHNGTLNINIANKDMSDTWHFSKLLQSTKITNKLLRYLPKFTGFDRLIFMGSKSIHKIGRWDEYEGNMWSNLNWQWAFSAADTFGDKEYQEWLEKFGGYYATDYDEYNGYISDDSYYKGHKC